MSRVDGPITSQDAPLQRDPLGNIIGLMDSPHYLKVRAATGAVPADIS